MAITPKDPRLQTVVDALVADLGTGYFAINDFWDADQIAVGLSRPHDLHHLVYLAVASPDSKDPQVVFSCDHGEPDSPDFEGPKPQPGTYAEIREAVRRHLGP